MGRDGGSTTVGEAVVSSLEAVRLLDAAGRGSDALLRVQPLGMLWLHAGAAAHRSRSAADDRDEELVGAGGQNRRG